MSGKSGSLFDRLNGVIHLMRRNLSSATTAAIAAVVGCLPMHTPLYAHEYWIEPLSFTRDLDSTVLAHFRNGENFSGASLPYIDDKVVSAKVYTAVTQSSIQSRLGDLPAIHFEPKSTGWHLFALQTAPLTLQYESQLKFQDFLRDHDLLAVIDRHEILNDDFAVAESYTRYAKSFVKVVDGNALSINATGHLSDAVLKFEWVLDANANLSDASVNLKLLHEGKVVPDRQAEVYLKSDSRVSKTIYKTDEYGLLHISTDKAGVYLVNAVRIDKVGRTTPTISTEWASLTFEVTNRQLP